MQGKFHTRAEWVKHKACDILRDGVFEVAGVGPGLQTMHPAESFGMNCAVQAAAPATWRFASASTIAIGTSVGSRTRACLRRVSGGSTASPIRWTRTAAPMARPSRPCEDINFGYIEDNLVGSRAAPFRVRSSVDPRLRDPAPSREEVEVAAFVAGRTRCAKRRM